MIINQIKDIKKLILQRKQIVLRDNKNIERDAELKKLELLLKKYEKFLIENGEQSEYPVEKIPEKRYALCLFGLVGSSHSKSGDDVKSSEEVLRLGFGNYSNQVLSKNIPCDVFIHTWNQNLEKQIIELYKPKSIITEEQAIFSDDPRIQAGYSRWYSHYIANKLKKKHEKTNKFTYSAVMVGRFDLVLKKEIIFEELSLNKNDIFYCNDYLFISSSKNSDLFSQLYLNLDDYGTRDGYSNKKVFKSHVKKMNMKISTKVAKNFPVYLPNGMTERYSQVMLVRDEYFKFLNKKGSQKKRDAD